MPRPAAPPTSSPPPAGIDVKTFREFGHKGLGGRLAFATIYAILSLAVLPWPLTAAWIVTVFIWEAASTPLLDLFVARLERRRAIAAYSAMNFIGSCIYATIAFLGLADGGPVGVALGASWIVGSLMNQFVYFSGDRWLLWTCLTPTIAAAVIAPLLAHGLDVEAAAVSLLILASALAVRQFSVDHRDLSEKLAAGQLAVADLERKFSIAVEAAGDGIFETDRQTGETQVNAAWLSMLGYRPGELDPIPDPRSFVHPGDLPDLLREYEAHLRGETPNTTSELRMRCKSGEYKWVLSRGKIVSRSADGAARLIVGTTIDISARKALEHQLEAARDLAESANTAKSMFVANMSHEIRTPLNGVIGVAGALARTDLTAPQQEMVALVQSSGQVLERLLSDILDQAKIEAGHFQLQIAPFDLRREIEAAAELLRVRAEDKGVAFQVVYDDPADGLFEGDAVRLKQIVSNLASNAIKFTHRGSVRIGIEALDPADATSATRIRIVVADTGVGFDAEAAGRLFTRFVQADGSISRQFGGTGLGLSICKTLTELMGGLIEARSDPGAGSVFTVELPLERTLSLADYRRRVAEPAADASETVSCLAQVRILLAEDSTLR